MATTLESIRETVRWTSGINLVAGLWLISAPFVLGYAYITNNALWNDIIVGIVVAAIAAVRVAGPLRHAAVSWINAALGAWLIVAPFVLTYSAQAAALAEQGDASGARSAATNDVLVGLVVLALGAWSALSGRKKAS